MPLLCFDHADGSVCQLTLSEVALPRAIKAQMKTPVAAWFDAQHLRLNLYESELPGPLDSPMFYEWQRLEWLFEPGDCCHFEAPLALWVNRVPQSQVRYRTLAGKPRLMGSFSLENAVGRTRFEVVDARGKVLFSLGVEVFPQKLDYKDDFPAMLDEITEVLYSLAFDAFTKTFASTSPRVTYRQMVSEWLSLFRVLFDSLEVSLATLLRTPKSELRREHRVKPIHRIKKATPRGVRAATRRPDRYSRGGGLSVAPGIQLSHLPEEHKQVSYDTVENRFVAWALAEIIRQIERTMRYLRQQSKISPKRVEVELAELETRKARLRRKLQGSVLGGVGPFQHQSFFSTTLTMAPGYKEFYHRFLLLRKGLALAENDVFQMDYKDIATLYEYWCFLKTVKLLRDNPKYDLVSNDIVKLEHHRLRVNLKKGKKSAVHFVQKSTGDDISMYFNRTFGRQKYTHTFDQKPDQFIEFSRQGFDNKGDKKFFKVVLDAKYRFDRESEQYPDSPIAWGPPLDTIAQLHRYRDAILWHEGFDESVRVANKSIGGVILFPYPGDEQDFRQHPFYQSIANVNIGAVPLQPGRHRENQLFSDYLESLFEQPGEVITQSRVHYDNRIYRRRKAASKQWVLVGMVPKNNREARLDYHFQQRCFYIPRPSESKWPLEQISVVALYDQAQRQIIGWAEVEHVEIRLGKELAETGTTWPPRRPELPHYVYRLGEVHSVNLNAGAQMSGHRQSRYLITRLGFELALQEQEPELQFIGSWDHYIEWKRLRTRYPKVQIKRTKTMVNAAGEDVSELEFIPVDTDLES